jgi:hypothetical protein
MDSVIVIVLLVGLVAALWAGVKWYKRRMVPSPTPPVLFAPIKPPAPAVPPPSPPPPVNAALFAPVRRAKPAATPLLNGAAASGAGRAFVRLGQQPAPDRRCWVTGIPLRSCTCGTHPRGVAK